MKMERNRSRRVGMPVVLTALALLTAAFSVVVAGAQGDTGLPQPDTHQRFSVATVPPAENGTSSLSLGQLKQQSGPVCTTSSTAANVNTDCEAIPGPHNETTVAVNPTDALNIVGSANDYQLSLTSGGAVKQTIVPRVRVTFDGGTTWTEHAIQFPGYDAVGDPAVAFDGQGTAYLSVLAFVFSQGLSPISTAPDVLVAHSTDGGLNWSAPVRVAAGAGSSSSVSLRFPDKDYVAGWGSGNAIVTWSGFVSAQKGSYVSSAIFASVTHNGGKTWTTPTSISGSAAFCFGSSGGTACDQDQASIPVVAADGSVYVAFENYAAPVNVLTGRDQYLVVKVDPATGQTIAGPYRVGTVFDAVTDYPVNINGRPTYQDSEFRTFSFGNITADPTNAAHLAVVWSDTRNSDLPVSPDPYAAETDSDIIVSQSYDSGVTWSTPAALARSNDQFMPFGAYDSGGKLRIGYFDRFYDGDNHEYGYTLATESSSGSLTFTTQQLTTALSQPTKDDRWFAGITVNPDFPHPTSFMGDYSGIAAKPGGGVVALWTDLRLSVCFTVRCGFGQDIFFAKAS